jgi:RNA polymerase sigma-70 factor (ECF subfamily)
MQEDYWNRSAAAPWLGQSDAARLGRESDTHSFVRALKQRSPTAWAAVYEEHYVSIFGYAAARIDTIDKAEDVVASTFQRALANIDSYSPGGTPFVAWLFGIARNVLREERRRARRVTVAPLRVWYQHVASRVPFSNRQDRRKSHDPEVVEKTIDLRNAIQSLTPDQRDVIILRYVQDLPIREVALRIGKPESAIYSLQARAIAALRRRLDDAAR